MKYLFLSILTTTSCSCFSQQPNKTFADTVLIYKGFNRGGTTANLWFYSKAVDTVPNISKIQLSGSSLDTLNYLIGHVKSKRHLQQKVGQSFYASIIKDGNESRIAIVPNWAIIDLTKKKQYVFKDTPYSEIYNRFVDKNYR